MNKTDEYRWIRPDGREVLISDRRKILSMTLSGEIGDDDLVRMSDDRPWVRASELRRTMESTLDVEPPLTGFESTAPGKENPWGAQHSEEQGESNSTWSPNDAPWRRYFARLFDLTVASLAVGIVAAIVFPAGFADDSADGLLFLAVALVGFPVLDALFLSKWQTSPGKWLLSVRTIRSDGSTLSFEAAFGRAYRVIMQGMWFGLPLLAIIPLIIARGRVSRREPQPWEVTSGTRTEVQPLGPKFFLFLCAIAVMLALFFAETMATM